MNLIWFKKAGWLYVPVHGMGLVVTLVAIVFMIQVSMATLRSIQPLTDNLITIFICGSCTAFWWKWIAEKTS